MPYQVYLIENYVLRYDRGNERIRLFYQQAFFNRFKITRFEFIIIETGG